MFNKIVLIDNKIATVKYIIEWQERFHADFNEETGEEQFQTENHSDWAVNEADKEMFIQNLDKRNIEYSITAVEIPESIKIHDNEEWTKGRDEAILYINGIGEYNPVLVEIKNLRQQLTDTDYKAIKFAEGVISESEFEEIRTQRQQCRERINTLEQQLRNIA